MELILTKDIPNVGIANEVVRVKDGFARNYLLPKKLAVIATAAAKVERAAKIEKAVERKKQRLSEAQELADRMSRLSLKFLRKSSEEGRLFGSVTKEEIAEQLAADHHIEIDRKQVSINQALKTLGETPVKIKLETGISTVITVMIESENYPELTAAAPVVEEVAEETEEAVQTVEEEAAEEE